MEIWGNSTIVQFLHQSNVYIKRKVGLWRARKFIPLVGAKSALTCACPQTTLSHVMWYMAKKGNLGKFGPTFRHGAVFVPKQYLYQKETRAMESSKMYSSRWCKKRTYLCGSTNYPVSCKALLVQEGKFLETRAYLSPWCSVCTKRMFISKGS